MTDHALGIWGLWIGVGGLLIGLGGIAATLVVWQLQGIRIETIEESDRTDAWQT